MAFKELEHRGAAAETQSSKSRKAPCMLLANHPEDRVLIHSIRTTLANSCALAV